MTARKLSQPCLLVLSHLHLFGNHFSLQLREHCDDLHDRFTDRCGSIKLFLYAGKTYPVLLKSIIEEVKGIF